MDDGFCFPGQWRLFRSKRPGGKRRLGGDEVVRIEQRSQREAAEAQPETIEELPTRQEVIFNIGGDSAAGWGVMRGRHDLLRAACGTRRQITSPVSMANL